MKNKGINLLIVCLSLLLLLGGCGNKKVISAEVQEQVVELPKTPSEKQEKAELGIEETSTAEKKATEEKEGPAHEHDYKTSVVAATCTVKGYTLHQCACGDSYRTDETTALGHDYQTSMVEATADAQGYTLHRCSRCGDSYQDNYTEKKSAQSPVDHWTLEGGISAYDPIVKEYAHNYNPQQAADVGNAYIQSLGLAYCPTMDTSSANYTGISFGGDQIWLKGGQAWYNEQAKAQVDYTKHYLDTDCGGSDYYQLYCTAGCSDYTTMYQYGVTVWYTFK